jgi:hypothetical protein
MLRTRTIYQSCIFQQSEKHYGHKCNIREAITVILVVERKAAVNCQVIASPVGRPEFAQVDHVSYCARSSNSKFDYVLEESIVLAPGKYFLYCAANDGAKCYKSRFF